MPSTYSAQDAVNLVQAFAHGAPLTVPAPAVVDQVNSIIWRYYPWGWTIASLTQTNLVQLTQAAGSAPTGGAQFTGNQQDYTITGAWFTYPISLQVGGATSSNFGGGFIVKQTPNGFSMSGNTVTINCLYAHNLPVGAGSSAIGQTGTIVSDGTVAGYNGSTVTITSIPDNKTIVGTISSSGLANDGGSGNPNILRPLKMRIARLDTNPPEYRELASMANLGPELSRTAGIDTMSGVGWFASQGFFRFDRTPQVSTGQIIQLLGEYQKVSTKITSNNLTAAFPFPDHYFNVLEAGLLWRVYQLTDDQRAGQMLVAKNGRLVEQFSGQLGTFMMMLREMARTEDLGTGDEFRFPEFGLGIGRSYWPGLYGV